ncbi:MAG: hypothetical protein DRQ02_09985 [Candidatus Latescibacterota bacterium]|nr:MAG: hypothetical protein DRQ02_09985 [Candidatus Latescibacterota bacterium]
MGLLRERASALDLLLKLLRKHKRDKQAGLSTVGGFNPGIVKPRFGKLMKNKKEIWSPKGLRATGQSHMIQTFCPYRDR